MTSRPVKDLTEFALEDARVAGATLSEAKYEWPEDNDGLRNAVIAACTTLGWAEANRGCLGNIVNPGDRVVVKPNLVLHFNQGTGGMLPLITHARLIEIVVEEILKAEPENVVVGDAPIQGCDLPFMIESTGLKRWAEELSERTKRFLGIEDFRRTTCVFENGVRIAKEGLRPIDDFVLFDLGKESLLEPITTDQPNFRVTSYDPAAMARTHSRSKHQYLIAKQVIDADVVVNLPKLKTHKKAGITCALKNLVGINGNKEYLPHHRIGGSDDGGDCYPGSSLLKRNLELLLDRRNSTTSRTAARFFATLEKPFYKVLNLKGDKIGIEGSWSGNDTVPRMTLDLNRIALYGTADATLADEVQRKVVHIVDGVVAGQGNGPLASDEFPLGRIFAGSNAAAVDWVAAHFLGYDPMRIPLLRMAYGEFHWKVVDFDSSEPALLEENGDRVTAIGLGDFALKSSAIVPAGWVDARIRSEAQHNY